MQTSNKAMRPFRKLHILLAEDDPDDCLLFQEVLEELALPVQLTTVHNGEALMERLAKKPNKLPHVLFLDLNMPRKNGFACLAEIKRNDQLQQLPVIILSTAFDPDMLNLVYKDAAHYYIRKPTQFSQLKEVIHQALLLIGQKIIALPGRANFVLTGNFKIDGEA